MRDISLSVRVLSMKSATDRQSMITKTIKDSISLKNLPFDFFYAVSHMEAGLQYKDLESALASGRTMSPAECSCFASHYRIYKDFLSNTESDFLLVMEDDVYIDPYFNLQTVIEMMNASQIDYLRLFCRAHVPAKNIIYQSKYQIVRFNWSPGGTQSYVLSRKGAKNLIKHIEKDYIVRRPIDIEMDRCWEVGNAVYAIYPQPVLEFNIPTTIHSNDQITKRVATTHELREGGDLDDLRNKFRRIKMKFSDSISRKIDHNRLSKQDKITHQQIKIYFNSKNFRNFQSIVE